MWFSKFAIVAGLIINLGPTIPKYDPFKQDKFIPANLFTSAEADKILGIATHLTDSVSKNETLSSTYLCGYKADKADPKTGKIGALYFFFERYNTMADADKRYSDVYISNQAHGMEKVDLAGEEALYHTDHQNFDLMMVRKRKYVFSIKVNKRTSTTSLTALKYALKRVSDQL
jgi:hypothetical protein